MGACLSVGNETALIDARRQYDAGEKEIRKHVTVLNEIQVVAPQSHKQNSIVMNGKEWCPDCRRELHTAYVGYKRVPTRA